MDFYPKNVFSVWRLTINHFQHAYCEAPDISLGEQKKYDWREFLKPFQIERTG